MLECIGIKTFTWNAVWSYMYIIMPSQWGGKNVSNLSRPFYSQPKALKVEVEQHSFLEVRLKDREGLERRRDEDAQAISNTRKESEDYFGKKGKWKSTNCMKLILKLWRPAQVNSVLTMDLHIYSDPTLFTLHVDIRSEIKIIMRSIIQYGGASILCYKIKL